MDEIIKDEETYIFTPKAIAVMAAYDAGLIEGIHDPKFEKFWKDYKTMMLESGYVEE